jgi:Prp8 binding protein
MLFYKFVGQATTGSKAISKIPFQYQYSNLISCGADKVVAYWDAESGGRIRKHIGHAGFVNSVCSTKQGSPLFVSGSDDGTARVK